MTPLRITGAIILAHILTGTASVATRYLVAWLDPVEIVCLRYLFGSIVIGLAYMIFRRGTAKQAYFLKSLGLGILFFAIFPLLFTISFTYTTAARGALVIATMPVWAMLIGHFTRHESMTPRLVISVLLTFSGLALALSDRLALSTGSLTAIKGELIMLAAAMVGAIYSILAKKSMKSVNPLTYTPIMMAAGWLFLSPWALDANLAQKISELSATQVLAVIYLGCLAGGLAFFLFNWVLHHATATYATLFVPLNPLTAIFLGWLLLGESLQINFLLGSAIVFSGLIIARTTLKKATNNSSGMR